jgi:transcriptional regulator with XRE-family HTH domain
MPVTSRARRSRWIVRSAGDLGRIVRERRARLKLSREQVAGKAGVESTVVQEIERGRGDPVEHAAVRGIVNALELDIELRARSRSVYVGELGLSRSALAALDAAGIQRLDQLGSSSDLLDHPAFRSGLELYEIVCALNRQGLTLPLTRRHVVPGEREREMLRLRVVEGWTLKEIGERFSVIGERVRQLLAVYFGLHAPPPAASGRRRSRAS